MNERDFRAQVKMRTPPGLSPEAVEVALQVFTRGGWTESYHMRGCMETAGLIAAELSKAKQAQETTPRPLFRVTPGLLLTSRQLAAAITPWVKQVRTDLFGRPELPFRSYAKAVAWIENAASEQDYPSSDERQQARAMLEKMNRELKAVGRILRSEVQGPTPVVRTVPYAKPGSETTHHVPVVFGSGLARLEAACRDMADATGFSQLNIIEHVLAGVPLLLPVARLQVRPQWRYHLPVPPDGMLSRLSATVEFLSPRDVTADQLKWLARQLRKMLGVTRAKRMSDHHHRLLSLVAQLGGPPKSNKIEWWEQFKDEWNKRLPRGASRYVTWRGPEMAYQRLQTRLASSSSSLGVPERPQDR